MSDGQEDRSLHIFPAMPRREDGMARRLELFGDFFTLENHQDDYFNPSCRIIRHTDMSAFMSAFTLGTVEVEVARTEDEFGREMLEQWCQDRVEVIAVYREFEKVGRAWKDKQTVILRGYISSVKIQPGPSCISLDARMLQITRDGVPALRIPDPLDHLGVRFSQTSSLPLDG